ncbi:MAG: hydrolase [Pirellulales bacterium]
MSSNEPLPRSPELMSADDTALLVVDVQEKLMPLVRHHERIIWNIRRLIDAAEALQMPIRCTEQYPQGLGHTVPQLAERLPDPPSKTEFSCAACGQLFTPLLEKGVHRVLVTGIETHVCVQQTVYDLMAAGFVVYVAVDATDSRYKLDYRTALGRMDSAGANLTTTEAAMFEWCRRSDVPQFKRISQLVKETAPDD